MNLFSFTIAARQMSCPAFANGEIVTSERLAPQPITIDNYHIIPAFGEDLLD